MVPSESKGAGIRKGPGRFWRAGKILFLGIDGDRTIFTLYKCVELHKIILYAFLLWYYTIKKIKKKKGRRIKAGLLSNNYHKKKKKKKWFSDRKRSELGQFCSMGQASNEWLVAVRGQIWVRPKNNNKKRVGEGGEKKKEGEKRGGEEREEKRRQNKTRQHKRN